MAASLNFFDDVLVEVQVDAVEPAALGDEYVVSGTVVGAVGTFVLAVHRGTGDRDLVVSGSASTPVGLFQVSTMGGGVYGIEEIDTTVPSVDEVVPFDGDDIPVLPSSSPGGPLAFVDPAVSVASSGTSQIDVLVLYTQEAAAVAGGEANMRAEVERLFAEMNTAFRNSGVSAHVTGWAGGWSTTRKRMTSAPTWSA